MYCANACGKFVASYPAMDEKLNIAAMKICFRSFVSADLLSSGVVDILTLSPDEINDDRRNDPYKDHHYKVVNNE